LFRRVFSLENGRNLEGKLALSFTSTLLKKQDAQVVEFARKVAILVSYVIARLGGGWFVNRKLCDTSCTTEAFTRQDFEPILTLIFCLIILMFSLK